MAINPHTPARRTRPPAPTQQIPAVGAGRSTRRRMRAHHWLLALIAVGMLAITAVMMYLRFQPVDRSAVIGLVGLFPFVAVPLAVASVAAAITPSRVLRTATAVAVASFVITVNPVDAVIGCGAETADDEIRLLTVNVLVDEGVTPTDLVATIQAHQPDIFVLQEVNWDYYVALNEDRLLADYPHRSTDTDASPIGVLVWSKWPLSEVDNGVFGAVSRASAMVDSPHGRFEVSAIHTTAPARQGNVSSWLGQFDQLIELDTTQPRILAGDFNATDDHYPFRALLAQGWTDVHDNKGCGPDATWPTKGLPFAIYRLDHVLMTDHFEPLGVQMLNPKGSDHKPVLATFRLAEAG